MGVYKMKIRSKRTIQQANKIFTDREQPRASFWKNYEMYKNQMQENGDIRVLSYYGIGGIGKSTLLKKLMAEMDDNITNPKYVYYDFSFKQDSKSVLESIKSILSKDYKFEFPLFDLGLYCYAEKIGENISEPEIKTFIEKSPILDLVVSAAGMIPGIGIIPQLFTCADKGYTIAKKLLDTHKTNIIDMDEKTPSELYAHLPYLFALDLTDNLNNSKEPLVIFLDTYEKLVNEMSSVGEPLENDKWLRGEFGLIQNIPNVLWVIAGREKLKWERFDIEWTQALEQHILGELTISDATEFLKNAGVEESALREQLYHLTKGTPVYLDLCVDTYTKLKEQGVHPQINDFGQDIYALIERFAKYMDRNLKEIVYILACLQSWNDEMATSIIPTIFPGFTHGLYENVMDLSFITKIDEQYYSIHQTVGSVLLQKCPNEIREKAQKAAANFCKAKSEKQTLFSDEQEYYLRNLLNHGMQSCHTEGELILFYLDNYIDTKVNTYFEKGRFETGHVIFDPFLDFVSQDRNSELYSHIARDYSRWMMMEGKYQLALDYAQDAYELQRKYFGENSKITIGAMRNLATALSYLKKDEEALDMYKEVYEKTILAYGKNHPEVIGALNNIASAAHHLGQYREAVALNRQVYEMSRDIFGENDPETLFAMGNLASGYAGIGMFQESLDLYEQVYVFRKKTYGEDHPATLIIMDNLGMVLEHLERNEEALEMYETVFDKRRKVLGPDHPATQQTQGRMIRLFDRQLKKKLGID